MISNLETLMAIEVAAKRQMDTTKLLLMMTGRSETCCRSALRLQVEGGNAAWEGAGRILTPRGVSILQSYAS